MLATRWWQGSTNFFEVDIFPKLKSKFNISEKLIFVSKSYFRLHQEFDPLPWLWLVDFHWHLQTSLYLNLGWRNFSPVLNLRSGPWLQTVTMLIKSIQIRVSSTPRSWYWTCFKQNQPNLDSLETHMLPGREHRHHWFLKSLPRQATKMPINVTFSKLHCKKLLLNMSTGWNWDMMHRFIESLCWYFIESPFSRIRITYLLPCFSSQVLLVRFFWI